MAVSSGRVRSVFCGRSRSGERSRPVKSSPSATTQHRRVSCRRGTSTTSCTSSNRGGTTPALLKTAANRSLTLDDI
ncbi:hypothetical protein DIPPA_33596 [Diplonema papillatum]|nr:hypothetical protein DIPPA_33596 [Diplonema papillatum]